MRNSSNPQLGVGVLILLVLLGGCGRKVDIQPPAQAADQPRIQAHLVDEGVALLGTAVPYADESWLLRRDPDGSQRILMRTEHMRISWLDNDLDTGKEYAYQVLSRKAQMDMGSEVVQIEFRSLPARPQVQAHLTAEGIRIDLHAEEAGVFEILRSVGDSRSYRHHHSTRESSWTDEQVVPGQQYRYLVHLRQSPQVRSEPAGPLELGMPERISGQS